MNGEHAETYLTPQPQQPNATTSAPKSSQSTTRSKYIHGEGSSGI